MTDDAYRAKVLGAWLGKAVGGTLGQPWESCTGPLGLTFYDPVPTDMMPNDDVDLQVVWACRLATDWQGVVSRENFADAWLRNVGLPYDEYAVARRNLARGIPATHSGAYDNAFANGLGAAIRSEIWAALAPGDPALAARLARIDASVDHDGEGVYAEQFLAALESSLFASPDIGAAINAGLAQIPDGSRLKAAVNCVAEWCGAGLGFNAIRENILREWGSANFTDVLMNVPFAIAALLMGGGNFGKTICLAVNFGRDTDCTGATVGAILGIRDPGSIPDEWLAPIGRALLLSEGIEGIDAPKTLDELTDIVVALRGRIRIEETEAPRPDFGRYAIRFRRGVFRPWFASDFRRFRPEVAALDEETMLPGNVAEIDFGGIPPESLLLLETTITLPADTDARLMVSTSSNFRAWLDGEPILGQEYGPFVPAFHRAPANQLLVRRIQAGPHKLRIGLAPATADMQTAPLAFGVADAGNFWLPDGIYDRAGGSGGASPATAS